MATTLTFDSKSDSSSSSSFDPTKMSAPPVSVIVTTIISLSITIPMIALSVVNYGTLSIWLNSTVAFLILVYHLAFLIVVFVYRKSFTSMDTPIIQLEDDNFDDIVKMSPPKPQSIAYNNWSLIALIFLLVATIIAFCIMVDITSLGAIRSTLPTERVGSHKWNIKIQMAQTTVLGCQVLAMGALLGITAWGRRRIVLDEENRSQEVYIV